MFTQHGHNLLFFVQVKQTQCILVLIATSVNHKYNLSTLCTIYDAIKNAFRLEERIGMDRFPGKNYPLTNWTILKLTSKCLASPLMHYKRGTWLLNSKSKATFFVKFHVRYRYIPRYVCLICFLGSKKNANSKFQIRAMYFVCLMVFTLYSMVHFITIVFTTAKNAILRLWLKPDNFMLLF